MDGADSGDDRAGTESGAGTEADASFPARLRGRLQEAGLGVIAAGEVDGTLELVYETSAPVVPPGQVGTVLSTLRAAEKWEPRDVGATVVDRQGETVGVWSVEGEWVRALREGELSEETFTQRAIDSIHNY
jgi:hypothetical protein